MATPQGGEVKQLTRRPWAFLLAPTLTMLIGMPLAGMPFAGDPRGFWAPYTLIALPFYLGLLAAPGYIAALLVDPRQLYLSAGRRLWVRASLILGLVCGVAGTIGGTMMVLFIPPALASAVGCGLLLRRFERTGRTLRGG